ncbi:MAG: hypothetical protein H6Q90_3868 [Deltaproteobacteria bacterium]|nr:hypothetical protein [Deltaproteobacteria bacterium]
MTTRAVVLAASRAELRTLLASGHSIDSSRLDDTVYRGISLGLPAWVERLSWKKFAKVFHRDARTGRLRGWNVRIEQDGLDRPWRARVRDGQPWTFGHFAVVAERDRLLLDYGAGGNPRMDPLNALRDPLVALRAGSVELLLGWSYLALGPARIPTPSYFLLERDAALEPAAIARAPRP